MNEQYSTYLNSDAWRAKRWQRLGIGKFQCAVCGSKSKVEVHHLTYARIFNENMEDLMPLCWMHHQLAEKLIQDGILTRMGEPLFLAGETIRLLAGRSLKRKKRDLIKQIQRNGTRIETRNRIQERLLNESWLPAAMNMSRKHFLAEVREHFCKERHKGLLIANACAIYDREFRRAILKHD